MHDKRLRNGQTAQQIAHERHGDAVTICFGQEDGPSAGHTQLKGCAVAHGPLYLTSSHLEFQKCRHL